MTIITKLPHGILAQARQSLLRFADASSSQAYFHSLVDRASVSEDLPPDDAVATDLVVLQNAVSLVRSFKAGARFQPLPNDVDETLAELWEYASQLDASEQLALDVLLRRAFDPVEALATWPLDVFFSPSEIEWLNQADRQLRPPAPLRLQWAPGQSMSYEGYICAIVKFTRLCNLRCTYCHDWRAETNQIMPFQVQARLFQQLLGTSKHASIEVVWHGGEPTLIGKKAFLRILALQRWFRRPAQQVANRIQTNATTIDSSWVDFFIRYGMNVGVSIDGPSEIHDKSRPHVSGRSTFGEVQRGLKLLQQANLLKHVYLVIGEATLALGADKIVMFLQEHGLTHIGVLPTRPGNGPKRLLPSWVDRDTYMKFLLDLHRARKRHSKPWIHVRELDSAIRAVRGDMPGHCELLGNCVGAFISVEPDGHIGHCDKFVGDSDFTIGNIMNESFDDIRTAERARMLMLSNHNAQKQQMSCPYFHLCQGWCPHERYISERYERNHNPSCCGLSPLFEALQQETTHGNGER